MLLIGKAWKLKKMHQIVLFSRVPKESINVFFNEIILHTWKWHNAKRQSLNFTVTHRYLLRDVTFQTNITYFPGKMEVELRKSDICKRTRFIFSYDLISSCFSNFSSNLLSGTSTIKWRIKIFKSFFQIQKNCPCFLSRPYIVLTYPKIVTVMMRDCEFATSLSSLSQACKVLVLNSYRHRINRIAADHGLSEDQQQNGLNGPTSSTNGRPRFRQSASNEKPQRKQPVWPCFSATRSAARCGLSAQ